MEIKFLKLEDLEKNPKNRDIRVHIVEQITTNIEKKGYNPAAALSVKQVGDKFIVADGNHRFDALSALKYSELIPCVVYPEDGLNIYAISANGNDAAGIMAQIDLFDNLQSVEVQKEAGFTHAVIAENMGESEDVIKQYSRVLSKVEAILDFAKFYQKGRSTLKVEASTFDFTVNWFKESGLYSLCPAYQNLLLSEFKDDRFKWNSAKVKKESAKYKLWQEFFDIAELELVNEDDLDAIVKMIEAGIFKNTIELRDKIQAFNDKAKNKLIRGDCIVALDSIDDASVNLVITDPPYGIDYSSTRSQFKEHVNKEKIANDGDLQVSLGLFDSVCEKLDKKTNANAHLYFFTSWKVYPEFSEVVSKYFKIKNMIVWDKGNHGSGDCTGAWGNRHELIIFATKGSRNVNKRIADIVSVPKINSQKAIHPTQKPVDLIKTILSVSAQEADVVCDPFMGSGSTVKAVKEHGGLSHIGIEIDRTLFEKAKAFIGK